MPHSHPRCRKLLVATVALAIAPSLWAQEISHPCASVAAPAERLACYDKAFPPPPEVIEEAKRKAKQDFGLREAGKPLLTPGMTSEDAAPGRIESRVVNVEYYGAIRRIALENGQAWRTTEATTSGPLREGDVIHIRKAALGNYLLVTPAGVTLRVNRVH